MNGSADFYFLSIGGVTKINAMLFVLIKTLIKEGQMHVALKIHFFCLLLIFKELFPQS